jgi:hypothetical protein
MWWPLPRAKLLKFNTEGSRTEWQGEHLAYSRSPWRVTHRRRVVVEGDKWEITDEVLGQGRHNVELRWQLDSAAVVISSQPQLIQLKLPGGWHLEVTNKGRMESALLRAEPNAGYESPLYGRKVPSATLSAKNTDQLPITFRSVVWKKD